MWLLMKVQAGLSPMSEPLIHMRAFLQDMQRQGALTGAQSAAVLNDMQQRWYARRTLAELQAAIERVLDAEGLPDARG